jgi:serine/threonine protein kinase
MASEYIHGGTLRHKVGLNSGKPRVTHREAVDLISGVLRALAHLHTPHVIAEHDGEHVVVHRDLKPENILLQGDTAKVTDFGVSKALRSSQGVVSSAGAIAYRAPETFDSKTDTRSDIWSAGVILFELLAGGLPFAGDNEAAVMWSILGKQSGALPMCVPPRLADVVERALAKAPAERYPSAVVMLEALDEAREELGASLRHHPVCVANADACCLAITVATPVREQKLPEIRPAAAPIPPDRTTAQAVSAPLTAPGESHLPRPSLPAVPMQEPAKNDSVSESAVPARIIAPVTGNQSSSTDPLAPASLPSSTETTSKGKTTSIGSNSPVVTSQAHWRKVSGASALIMTLVVLVYTLTSRNAGSHPLVANPHNKPVALQPTRSTQSVVHNAIATRKLVQELSKSGSAGEPDNSVLMDLVSQGADVNAHDKEGWTALMLAAGRGDLKSTNFFFKHNASINATNTGGLTALMQAASSGQTDCAHCTQLLLEHGADVNAKDNLGETALMDAAANGHADCVRLLLAHGADVNAKNYDGKTALDLAEKDEIKAKLRKAGAKE